MKGSMDTTARLTSANGHGSVGFSGLTVRERILI